MKLAERLHGEEKDELKGGDLSPDLFTFERADPSFPVCHGFCSPFRSVFRKTFLRFAVHTPLPLCVFRFVCRIRHESLGQKLLPPELSGLIIAAVFEFLNRFLLLEKSFPVLSRSVQTDASMGKCCRRDPKESRRGGPQRFRNAGMRCRGWCQSGRFPASENVGRPEEKKSGTDSKKIHLRTEFQLVK